MSKPIIEVNKFSYVYQNSKEVVLNEVSFTINEGDFVGIIGCNKAGKSTLCQAMVGILPFLFGGDWDGGVVVDGVDLNKTHGAGATDAIGIVFQDAESQFTQETVEDEIAFAMCNFGFTREVMRERILETAKACGIETMLNRSPLKLSGGQQQRLAVACILALSPKVIILDESTSQLDPIGRDEVFTLVAELHKKGTTVIMVDHNIEKIAEYVDKVMVLDKGEVVCFDEVSKVFQQKELLAKHNIRLPQVTAATLELRDKLSFDSAPIDLESAIEVTKGKLTVQGENNG